MERDGGLSPTAPCSCHEPCRCSASVPTQLQSNIVTDLFPPGAGPECPVSPPRRTSSSTTPSRWTSVPAPDARPSPVCPRLSGTDRPFLQRPFSFLFGNSVMLVYCLHIQTLSRVPPSTCIGVIALSVVIRSRVRPVRRAVSAGAYTKVPPSERGRWPKWQCGPPRPRWVGEVLRWRMTRQLADQLAASGRLITPLPVARCTCAPPTSGYPQIRASPVPAGTPAAQSAPSDT